MNRYFLIFFMVVGAGDLLYGIFSKDQISVLVGAIILILTIYVARKKGKETKETKETKDDAAP